MTHSSSRPYPLRRLQVYSQLEGDKSHAVNTAWALLALLAVGYHEVDRKPLDAAARCLIKLQVGGGGEGGGGDGGAAHGASTELQSRSRTGTWRALAWP